MNNQKWKKKFRYTLKWREFRKKMILRDKVDYVTGAKLTKLCNLHHLVMTDKEEEYTDLSDESKFICLNILTHKCLHFIWGKDWRLRYKRLGELLERMEALNKKQ